MKVFLAKTAGFCYGVRRAVELAEQAAEGEPACVMLGPVIHNQSVIDQLSNKGVILVQRPEDVPEGACVILRSHGEGKSTYDLLEKKRVKVMDTTCPNVSRIHRLVRQAQEEGRQVIIIGAPGHPEVQAIADWCSDPLIFQDGDQLTDYLLRHPEMAQGPVTMVSQTT